MFHVFPPSKKLREEVWGGGGREGGKSSYFKGALVVGNYGLRGGYYFRGGHLLEHGCLFKEIRYVSSNTTCRLQAITLSRKSFITAG